MLQGAYDVILLHPSNIRIGVLTLTGYEPGLSRTGVGYSINSTKALTWLLLLDLRNVNCESVIVNIEKDFVKN